jgi:hypothetical protein
MRGRWPRLIDKTIAGNSVRYRPMDGGLGRCLGSRDEAGHHAAPYSIKIVLFMADVNQQPAFLPSRLAAGGIEET